MNASRPEFAAVILAAGASSRMGTPKALLDAGGETFLDALAGVFLDAGCAVYAVVGPDAETIGRASRRSAAITFVLNPEHSLGQLSSLQCGLRAARWARGIFFTPVDVPGIDAALVAPLLDAFGQAEFVVPVRGGRHAHPVLLRGDCVQAFLDLRESATARDVLHARREQTRYVTLPGAALDDIDDPASYAAWRRGGAQR